MSTPPSWSGQVGFREGPLTAHCEEFEINIEGEGGHGARPESTRDPVAAATHLVQSVYASLPRRLDSREPLVVSFGVIQGGINPNVIPQSVQLRGTMRSFDAEHLRNARQRLQGICDSVAQMHQLEVRYEVSWDLPAVINDPHIIATARRSAASILPPGGAVEIPHPSMGGEDFAHYLRHCRGGMFRLGVGTPLQPVHHLHSPRFDLNEKALPIGSKLLARTLLQLAS
jgi:amidohydrolase